MSMNLNATDWLECEKLACKKLSNFVKAGWNVLEPGTPYDHGWHVDAMSDHLEAARSGEITRVLINVPPGTMKSSMAGVFFPAWLWGPAGMPEARYIGAAHEQTLATRDNRRTRLLVESEWYQDRWSVPITSDQNEKTFFENESRGFRQSSAVASMTGKRGHFVNWDDPINPEQANSEKALETATRIFKETLTTRLVNPINSVIIIIMQRLNKDDVSGYIIAEALGYEYLMLPMEFEPARRCYTSVKPTWRSVSPTLARFHPSTARWYTDGKLPDAVSKEKFEVEPAQVVYSQDPREEVDELLFEKRFPRSVVDRDKKVMGAYGAAGQFQQRPAPREGGMFKRANFPIISAVPPGCVWVRAWDLAASDETTSAWTAGLLMGLSPAGEYIIADVARDQLTASGVESLIATTASQDGLGVRGSIPQDPGAGGKAWAIAIIKAATGYDYHSSPESGDKVTRATPLSAQVEIKNVKLVRGDWNKAFLDEAEVFPAAKIKDQVDAASRAFMELTTAKTFEFYVGGDGKE